MGVLLDMAAQFANLDPGYIAETLTRQIVGSVTQAPQIIKDVQTFMSITDGSMMNYYEAGAATGRLAKILLDFTIDN
jgi:hypothetical protein